MHSWLVVESYPLLALQSRAANKEFAASSLWTLASHVSDPPFGVNWLSNWSGFPHTVLVAAWPSGTKTVKHTIRMEEMAMRRGLYAVPLLEILST